MKRKALWLIYRRTRVAFAFMGFIIMYSLYIGVFNTNIVLISISVFFAEMFGVCFNDYHDFDEDMMNGRTDKLTVSKLLSIHQMRYISIIMLFSCLIAAVFSGFLPIAALYIFLMWAYSSPKVRLKKYNIKGYITLASTWLLIPLYMGSFFRGILQWADIVFSLFFFFQYTYLLSQKDSTDPMDRTNLFIERGWKNAVNVCTTFAFLSGMFLFFISLYSPVLIIIWGFNIAIKIYQLYSTYLKKIKRSLRNNLTLMEFLTNYLFAGGFALVP